MFIYRVISNKRGGKYKYGTILQFIIHLIYFKVCMFIYRIISNKKGENINMGQYYI